MRFTSLAILGFACAVAAGPALAKTYALVIGIDEYDHIDSLQGAVNDAKDIADAIRSTGDAEVQVLLNGEANRNAILSSWRALAGKVKDGDRLIVTYAGHGSNEPEYFQGSEVDGRDETLLLSKFAPSGVDAGERIRDNELAELLELTPPGSTIFVADACHSGTLTRTVKPTLGWRFYPPTDLEEDPLPPPPAQVADVRETRQAMLFMAAADDASKVPELYIDGAPRGALSYSFAEALRGKADTNADGAITTGEVALHIRKSVRNLSNGLQVPQVEPGSDADTTILGVRSATPKAPAVTLGIPFYELPEMSLSSALGAGQAALLDGVKIVSAGQPAQLALDADSGELRTSVGDTIRVLENANDVGALQDTIDMMRAVDALKSSASGSLNIRFSDGDKLYKGGERIVVSVEGRKTSHVVLFNIASDGTLNLLYPLTDHGDPAELSADQPVGLPLVVVPPFGAEHIFAIETDVEATGMMAALKALDGVSNVRTVWNELGFAIAGLGGGVEVSVFPFHTAE